MNEIKKMRLELGLTQKQFSEITGIPKRTVESWEEEKRNPPEWLPKMIKCYLEANLGDQDTTQSKNDR